MGKMVIFIIIACVLFVVWSACVIAARADEKLREITDDKKEPEEKEEDMTKQRNSPEDVYCRSCVDKIENYMKMDIGKIMNESVIRTRPPVEKPPKKGK